MSSTSPLSTFAQIKTEEIGEESMRQPAGSLREGGMPRILVVTPEITYLPEGMGNLSQRMCAKAGGLADVSASLVNELQELGADVHVALPNYKRMFHSDIQQLHEKQIDKVRRSTPDQRIHLAQDRIFYHRDQVYSTDENTRIALAFQREVINHIIPTVEPDLIHCNDWMTGLIPAVAKQRGIKCLFTVHNIHTEKLTLAEMEDRGIDAAEFWEQLYYVNRPGNYEQTRSDNRVDLLTSGIFAADYVNTVSPTFLEEVVMGHHGFVPGAIQRELANKKYSGNASGILNAPDPAFEPETDEYIAQHYSPSDHVEARRANKLELQKRLGLVQDADAPVLFWPSRLDPVQKGCQLVTDILYNLLADYEDRGLQIAVVANGSFQRHFREIADIHHIHQRLAVHDFKEELSHLGYAGSDFILMPSSFEPCGLPQVISPKFGSLPIVHDTGGLHDTIQHLNTENDTGNGFVFQYFDTKGLRWATDQAMHFYNLPAEVKARQISRIMLEAKSRFNHHATAGKYIEIYRKIWRNREASQ
jgi:starch synthase